MPFTRRSFGVRGVYLPALLNWVSTCGWYAVNSIVGSLAIARLGHLLALVLFAIIIWELRVTGGHSMLANVSDSEITVTPGDTSMEKGSSLVVKPVEMIMIGDARALQSNRGISV